MKDVSTILTQLEDSFLKLAECQHMLEVNGKTEEYLDMFVMFSTILFLNPMIFCQKPWSPNKQYSMNLLVFYEV